MMAIKSEKKAASKAKKQSKSKRESQNVEAGETLSGGRPTAYKAEYAEQAKKLCLLVKATDKILAEFFEVCEKTINNWKINHPEFLQSIRAGKIVADTEVANGLYNRAIGATWIEEAAFKVKKVEYENGKKVREYEEVKVVQLQKAAPPDTPAAGIWLHNRSAEWRKDKDATNDPNDNPLGHADYTLAPDEDLPDVPVL